MFVHWNALFTDNKTALSSSLLQPDAIMITGTYKDKQKVALTDARKSYGGCKMSLRPTSLGSFPFWDLMGGMFTLKKEFCALIYKVPKVKILWKWNFFKST